MALSMCQRLSCLLADEVTAILSASCDSVNALRVGFATGYTRNVCHCIGTMRVLNFSVIHYVECSDVRDLSDVRALRGGGLDAW